jgi:DNA-binding LytR/AlgR family response regulator
MEKIRVLIVEDELIIANDLADILTGSGYAVNGLAKSYKEGLEKLKNEIPDIVLLDIQIAGDKDGVDLANMIKDKYQIPFIFISSHTDRSTLSRVMDSNPYGFLVKPFEDQDVLVAIELALNKFSKEQNKGDDDASYVINESLFIRQNNIAIKVAYDDILYAMADSNYCKVITNNKSLVLRSTLKDLEKKLKEPQFYRSHKSYLINLSKITAINSEFIFIGNEKLPVGREQQLWLMKHINKI